MGVTGDTGAMGAGPTGDRADALACVSGLFADAGVGAGAGVGTLLPGRRRRRRREAACSSEYSSGGKSSRGIASGGISVTGCSAAGIPVGTRFIASTCCAGSAFTASLIASIDACGLACWPSCPCRRRRSLCERAAGEVGAATSLSGVAIDSSSGIAASASAVEPFAGCELCGLCSGAVFSCRGRTPAGSGFGIAGVGETGFDGAAE